MSRAWCCRSVFGAVRDGDNLPGVIQEGFSLLGQLDGTGGALEQLYIQFLFQGLDLLADCRMGDMELLGCLAEVEILCHSQKAGELKGIHRLPP